MHISNSSRLLTLWLGWAVVIATPLLRAQAPAPELRLSRDPGSADLLFQVSSAPGFFYTRQASPDLTHWSWRGALFADSPVLTWTAPISSAAASGFFRAKADPPNQATVITYNGWTNAVSMSNGLVEAVVVPNAGRVLQFRLAGSTNGPFWENRLLYGRTASSSSWNTEGGFGGDKAWPSPQSDWSWPPPAGFDGSPNQLGVTNGVATLTTPVDSTYKIRTTRIVELGFDEPVLRIRTIFERTASTSRTNKPVGIWVITQVQGAARIYMPVPSPSVFPAGYRQLGTGMPAQFQNTNGMISFTRDPASSHKLGFDASSLVWVGTNFSMRIDAPRISGLPLASYPDGGCNTEVYTNPGSIAPYIELECLGPLALLPVGGRMEFLTTYTLFNRTESHPDAEARKILYSP